MVVRILIVLAVLLLSSASSVVAEEAGAWPRDVNVDSVVIRKVL